MIATINNQRADFNANNRKENKFSESYVAVAFENGKARDAVDLRIYKTDSRAYCCVWLHGVNLWQSGSAWAGGYGYHRASEAASTAFRAAGVSFDEEIGGRGDSAIQMAVHAAAKALFPDAFIHVVHAHA